MYQIDNSTAAVSRPAATGAGTPGWFSDGNPATSTPATIVPAEWLNMTMAEIVNFIQGAGLTLDKTNSSQLLLAAESLIEARSGNFSLDTGTANAYVIALNPAIPSYTSDFAFRFKVAHANTGASTLNAGGGAISLVNDVGGALAANDLTVGMVVSGQYVYADNKAYITSIVPSQISTVTVIQSKVRQTVSQGPVDTNGFPTFLPATVASLVMATQNVSTGLNALVVSAASGANANGDVNTVGQSTANLTWPACTASNTNFLPVLVNANGTLTPQTPVTLPPIYQQGGTPSVVAGQYTFNIAQMTMYLGNGTVANPVNHVIVGEAVAGASTITSSVAYAYQGKYRSATTNTLPASAIATNFNHNLGVSPSAIMSSPRFTIVCLTAEYGYSIGDVYCPQAWATASYGGGNNPASITGRNSAVAQSGPGPAWSLPIRTTGVQNGLTAANWAYFLILERGW